jgi:hypothetical protein
MSEEYEECWKYFKKDERNQSARCQICFKSFQCRAVDFIEISNIFMASKRTKNSENNPDEPVPTTFNKQRTILQYVKGQD